MSGVDRETADAFDAKAAITQVKLNWLRLGMAFSAAVESSASDWACDGEREADDAIAFASRAEACLWRATGDARAFDVPEYPATRKGDAS